jgi:long-chain acyl-CoA synthetase
MVPLLRGEARTQTPGGENVVADTIPHRLLEQARIRPHAPAYYVRDQGVWKATSWERYAGEAKRAAKALMALGVEPGQTTTILGFNRPEWVVFDLATMMIGGAPAGIYATCSPEEVAYIIDHAESPVCLVENEAQWLKVKAERENLPKLRWVVTMRGAPAIDDPMVLSYEAFLEKGDGVDEADLLARLHALEPEGLATLIYTSGTTGPPKGVMLSHDNLAWTAGTAKRISGLTSMDSVLSYLPLSHIAEQMFTIHGPITAGARVYFAESIDKVPENLKEVQPTVFFGVPRIWEKFHAGITARLREATGVKKRLVELAMNAGRKAAEARSAGRPADGLDYKLAKRVIFDKLKPAVGLGRARFCVSGAAPIAREVLEFFAQLDIIVLEVYGQSEDSGPTTFNMPDRFRFGSVGPRIDGIDVKIAEDGEILVGGRNVFRGYYKDEKSTNEALIDGFLHSGDLGEFRDGFLYITGRKKDIIITAGGKNVAPKNIEAALKNHDLINEAVVIGDRRKFLTALLTLDPDATPTWCEANGVDPKQAHTDPKVREEIQRWVDQMNEKFARVEQVKRFTLLERNFSVEDGELTPTLKVKRKKVNEHFEPQIEAMYAE